MSKEVTEVVVANIETSTEAVKEKEIQQEVSLVEIRAKEMVISSDDEYKKAAEFGKQIKEKAKTVTDFFKPMKNSAYQAHRAICDREKIDAEATPGSGENLEKRNVRILPGEGKETDGAGRGRNAPGG